MSNKQELTTQDAIKWVRNRMCEGRYIPGTGELQYDECWQAGAMAIKALRQGDWIPCSILPQEKDLSVDGMVLVQEKDTQRIFKGWYENIEGYNHWFDEMGFTMDAVMWCRLPEPYKGE